LNGVVAAGKLKPGDSWFLSPQKELFDRLTTNSFSVRPFLADCGIRTTSAKQQVVGIAEARPKDLPVLEGKRIGRYWCNPPTAAVRFDRGQVIKGSEEKYEFAEFLVRQTAAYPIVGPRRHARYFRNSLHALSKPEAPMSILYLVGLLNSKLLRFAYIAATREAGQRTFPQVKLGALAKLPLRRIDFGQAGDRKAHDEIVELVESLLGLQMDLSASGGSTKPSGIRARIQTLDQRLDDVVYRLYGIDASSRRIVDETLAQAPAAPDFPEALEVEKRSAPGPKKVRPGKARRKTAS